MLRIVFISGFLGIGEIALVVIDRRGTFGRGPTASEGGGRLPEPGDRPPKLAPRPEAVAALTPCASCWPTK